MFMVIFLAILFTNYVLVADLDEKYKIGYTTDKLLLCAAVFGVSISLQLRVNYKKWKEERESKDK